jgi:CelD/BcsL family acetyltransferase involved in cellulose biosynthesis
MFPSRKETKMHRDCTLQQMLIDRQSWGQEVLMQATTQQKTNTADNLSLEVHQDISALRDLWCTFQETALGGPHDTWEWNDAWARTAGQSCKAHIVIGRDIAGKVIFLLSLTIQMRQGCAILEWLGAAQGNYASGLFHPTAWQSNSYPSGKALLKQVLAALPRMDAVHLADQPTEVGNIANPIGDLPNVRSASPGHAFPLNSEWEAHFNERFSSKIRSSLRRSERRLADEGVLEFAIIEPGSPRIEAMDRVIRDKQKWFTDKGIHNFFAEREMQEFYRSLAQLPDDKVAPRLRIYEYRLDGETIAANLGIIHQNKFYGLIASTTDGPLRRFGPGGLMIRHIVEHLSNEGIEMFDCGAGEDDNKLRWCTQQRERQHAIVPVSVKGHVYAAVLKAKLNTKLQIKQNPQLWNMAKRLRQWKAGIKTPRPSQAATTSGSPAPGLQA